jgi:hypothetical protein
MEPSSSADDRSRIWRPLWLVTAIAGLLAGVFAGIFGEATNRAIPLKVILPPGYESMGGYQKDSARAQAFGKAEQIAEKQNAEVAYGALGLLLGGCIGLAGGLASGSLRSGLKAATLGAVTGAALSAGMCYALVPMFYRYLDPESGLVDLFLTHAGIFAVIGIAVGLALGWGLGDSTALGQAVLGGFLGALLGTFAFETINSLMFPLVRTFEPMPTERVPRLLVHLCVAVCAAVGAGLAVSARPTKTPARPAKQG